MQSKMTEREFREKIKSFSERSTSLIDDAVDTARAAGLEFAPEPPLPKVVELHHSHGVIELCPGGRTLVAGTEEKRALYQEAKARYNAYPGLRKAAEALADLFTYRIEIHGGDIQPFRDALSALRDELAKGPKP